MSDVVVSPQLEEVICSNQKVLLHFLNDIEGDRASFGHLNNV